LLDNKRTAQGTWSPSEQLLPINQLELKAMDLGVSLLIGAHRLPGDKEMSVLIMTDNSAACASINRQGSPTSAGLQQLAFQLWEKADRWGLVLRALHLAGATNVTADSLSRGVIAQSEL